MRLDFSYVSVHLPQEDPLSESQLSIASPPKVMRMNKDLPTPTLEGEPSASLAEGSGASTISELKPEEPNDQMADDSEVDQDDLDNRCEKDERLCFLVPDALMEATTTKKVFYPELAVCVAVMVGALAALFALHSFDADLQEIASLSL